MIGTGEQPTKRPAPPTQPGGKVQVLARESAWPLVIAIVAFLFGGVGVLSGGFGFLTTLATGFLDVNFPFAPDFSEYRWQMLAANFGWVATGLLLLWGGMLLIKRAPRARMVLIVFAVLKLLTVIPYAFVNYEIQQGAMAQQQQIMANMNQNAAQGTAQQAIAVSVTQTTMAVFATGGVVVTAIWGAVLPIFLLVWFGLGRIRREVSGWTGVRGPTAVGGA